MTESTGNLITDPVRRAWAAWCRFWFTPSDPTPLCLMRIVAGLLALYVHISYTFDLQALEGKDGWYSTAQADQERRQWPNFVPPANWGAAEPHYRMPPFPQQRATVRNFVERVATAPRDTQDRVLRLLDSLPDGSGGRAETLRYLMNMEFKAPTFEERDTYLKRMVEADPKDEAASLALPEYLLTLKTTDRELFRADAHALCDLLPGERTARSNIFTYLISQPGGEWQLLHKFIEEVRNKSDQADRNYFLDYAEKWSCSPDEKEIIAKGHWYYSPFYHVTEPTGVAVLHGIHLFVILLFTLGVCTRVTSVLTWLAALAYIQRNPVALFGQDTMMNLCLFYLMLAPCGATWSVDWLVARYRENKRALREGRRPEPAVPKPLVSATFVTRLLQIHYCMMYMSAGLSKLKGDAWWNGTAPFSCMSNPEFCPLHMPFYRGLMVWLCQDPNRWLWEAYMSATVIFTLFTEIGFPFLVWTRMRPVMVTFAILLHLGIALNMGLIVFSLFMFTLLLGAWMPGSAIRRVFARPPARLPKVQVNYDGASEKQLRAAAAVAALDVWGQADVIDRAAAKSARAATIPTSGALAVTAGGTTATGWSAARAVARSLGMTQPFAWLLGLPIVAQIGEARHPSETVKGAGGVAEQTKPARAVVNRS
jgi:hypothetical protein